MKVPDYKYQGKRKPIDELSAWELTNLANGLNAVGGPCRVIPEYFGIKRAICARFAREKST